MQLYERIDIALDTLPYNGHTTTLDAMWMGVPTVTLVGSTIVGRAGLSLWKNLGMTEFVAYDENEYVAKANELAQDRQRLERIRNELRGKMMASPLTDAKKFTRNLEMIYQNAWNAWLRKLS